MANEDLKIEPYNEDVTLSSETAQKRIIKTETCDGVFDESIKDLFSCWDKCRELANITIEDVINESDNSLLCRIDIISNLPNSEMPKRNKLDEKYIKEIFAICRMKIKKTSCPVTSYLSFEVDLNHTNNDGILRLTHQGVTYDMDIATTLLVTPEKAKQIKKDYFRHIKKDQMSLNRKQRGISFFEWVVSRESVKQEKDPVLLEASKSILHHFDTYICLMSNPLEGMLSRDADIVVLSTQHQNAKKAEEMGNKYLRILYISEEQASKLEVLTRLIAGTKNKDLKQAAFKILNEGDVTPDGTPFKCVSEEVLSLIGSTQEKMDLGPAQVLKKAPRDTKKSGKNNEDNN